MRRIEALKPEDGEEQETADELWQLVPAAIEGSEGEPAQRQAQAAAWPAGGTCEIRTENGSTTGSYSGSETAGV